MKLSRRAVLGAAAAGLSLPFFAARPQSRQPAGAEAPPLHLSGVYGVGNSHLLGVERFVTDAGAMVLMLADYRTSAIHLLSAKSATEFVATEPGKELTVTFRQDAAGRVAGLDVRRPGGSGTSATRVDSFEEDVRFDSDDARLAGRLILPDGTGPHPAVILLHGSGPLTRYSFGPYQRFFSSLGFAVLFYDKRGTGASTGLRLDVPTWIRNRDKYYPEDIAADALAAFRMLRARPEIDPRRIGFWGSSEGGMLTTHVAAKSADVAFAINSSGFMGPLWETMEYQIGTQLRTRGISDGETEEALALFRVWLQVARTGDGYEDYLRHREKRLASGRAWPVVLSRNVQPLEQMRWMWDHLIAFDSRLALRTVRCPVLGVFGAKDILTHGKVASSAMQSALSAAGNVTTHVFDNAGHSLMEEPGGAGMAPGVFATLRHWLETHIIA